MNKMDGKKNLWATFFKLNALKRKGLSSRRRRQNDSSTMFCEGATCPWRKGLSCLGKQLH
jgi:hypothetical protein